VVAGFAVARYNTDGSLDTAFGNGGKLGYNSFGAVAGRAGHIAVQSDGKILIAGGLSNLSRLNAEGGLDLSFANGGLVVDEPGLAFVFLQRDARILTLGDAVIGGGQGFGLSRRNVNGSLDDSFGNGGRVTTEFVHNLIAQGRAVSFQTDGKIVVAGLAQVPMGSGTGYAFALARYNPDGSLDGSFGSGGEVITQVLGGSGAMAVLAEPDGKVLAVGFADDTATRARMVAAVRYNQDGSLDTAFGTGGKATADFFGPGATLRGVAIREDGKFVAAGSAPAGSKGTNFGIAYFNNDGTPDTNFAAGGRVTARFSNEDDDDANGVAFQPDGQILAVGSTDGQGSFALARYDTELDFSISLDATSLTVERGTRAAVQLSINRLGGFRGDVTVSPSDTSALRIRVTPDSVTTSETVATFKIKVKANAPVGPQQITFTASDASGRLRTSILTVVVE
jgi:uncharacterized delta-60 repeat protein